MSEGHRFGGFGEDDPAYRRGPGMTGHRGDEEPDPEQRADVREIDLDEEDLDEEDRDERDPAEVEAAERVERLRAAARGEGDGQATVLLPPAREDEDAAGEGDAGGGDAQAPRPHEGDAPAAGQAAADVQDREETSRPVGAATVDIGPPAEEADREPGPPAGATVAAATAPPSSVEGDQAAVAGVDGRAPEATKATPVPRSGALLATDAEAVRRQFLDIQAGFVDEPRQAVEQAGELVEELHHKVLESLQAERAQLNTVLGRHEPSTEDLRLALRAYRAYVDRLLGLHL
jgi:hypothetical protein